MTPTRKDFRDLFKVLDANELQAKKIIMSEDIFDALIGPIIKAARKLLNRLHLDIYKKRGPFMLDDITGCEAEIEEILMKISKHPDIELSEQQATLLCQRFVKELDDTKPDIVNAAYVTLSHFLPMASKEARDAIIPAMVVHDL